MYTCFLMNNLFELKIQTINHPGLTSEEYLVISRFLREVSLIHL
jgi:hypothetical protein